MTRKLLTLLTGNAATSLLQLLRNLVLAWLLPIEDYGIASTFALAMTVVEMASQMGLQVLIVQSPEGNAQRYQAALQGLQVVRGLFSGATLWLAAGLIADFLRIPEVAWAYRMMAIVPILNALQHFDIFRLSREMRFTPMLLSTTIPALVSLAALWPLSMIYADYRVMLYALVLQAAVQMLTSHLVAERRYELVLDRRIAADALRFGWPILMNGILLFAVFQGDKIIVARELGMTAQALFAMGMTLTLTPTLVLQKSAQNFFLPQLSRLARSPRSDPKFAPYAQAALQAGLLGGALLVLATFIAGPSFVRLILGAKYAELEQLILLFAIVQGLRAAKSGPGDVALSHGRADTAALSNLPRCASLPLAWAWVLAGGDIRDILTVAILSEAAGLALALWHMQTKLEVPFTTTSRICVALNLLLCLTAWLGTGAHFYPPELQSALSVTAALIFAALVASAHELRGSFTLKI